MARRLTQFSHSAGGSMRNLESVRDQLDAVVAELAATGHTVAAIGSTAEGTGRIGLV